MRHAWTSSLLAHSKQFDRTQLASCPSAEPQPGVAESTHARSSTAKLDFDWLMKGNTPDGGSAAHRAHDAFAGFVRNARQRVPFASPVAHAERNSATCAFVHASTPRGGAAPGTTSTTTKAFAEQDSGRSARSLSFSMLGMNPRASGTMITLVASTDRITSFVPPSRTAPRVVPPVSHAVNAKTPLRQHATVNQSFMPTEQQVLDQSGRSLRRREARLPIYAPTLRGLSPMGV